MKQQRKEKDILKTRIGVTKKKMNKMKRKNQTKDRKRMEKEISKSKI